MLIVIGLKILMLSVYLFYKWLNWHIYPQRHAKPVPIRCPVESFHLANRVFTQSVLCAVSSLENDTILHEINESWDLLFKEKNGKILRKHSWYCSHLFPSPCLVTRRLLGRQFIQRWGMSTDGVKSYRQKCYSFWYLISSDDFLLKIFY